MTEKQPEGAEAIDLEAPTDPADDAQPDAQHEADGADPTDQLDPLEALESDSDEEVGPGEPATSPSD